MVTTAQEVGGEGERREGGEALCARCRDPLPLWATDEPRDDDLNFARPPAAAATTTTEGADVDTDMHATPPLDTVTHSISPVSDLIIHLPSTPTNPGAHRYLVSSQILRVVSPVWRRYLDPDSPFKSLSSAVETVSGRPHIFMTLHDDDPDTLLAVLSILHFSSEHVPTTSIDFAQLKSFAVLCDKYDCIHILNPYSKSWLDEWASVVLEPGYEDWLFIAKVFKDDRNVKELEDLLVEESSSLSVCGGYFLRSGREVETSLIPEIVLKRIMASRSAELTRQITVWRTFLQSFVSENVSKGCPNWDCVTLSYGNLIRSVEQSGLVKVFNLLEEWHGNIKSFEEKTETIHLANGTRFHGYGWCPVENLNVALRSQLERNSSNNE
ncbi:hypothetical protein TWF281_009054 [Arthrobotrys megalospora]